MIVEKNPRLYTCCSNTKKNLDTKTVASRSWSNLDATFFPAFPLCVLCLRDDVSLFLSVVFVSRKALNDLFLNEFYPLNNMKMKT